jgi:predicted DNA-binding transcriptional regulator YafY
MVTHFISRRIQYLIQFIYDYNFPSKSTILNLLKEKDFNISSRTLERDLERIRSDFGLEIAYNKIEDGYYIDEEKSVKVNSFFKFLEIVSVAEIFSNSLKDSNRILEHVSFDDSKSFKGIENIRSILLAITQNRKISFTHENFELKTFKHYQITPFLLKEYENRWYVVGVPNDMTEIRTFGIDRISDIIIEELSKLKKHKYQNQLNRFNDVIGLHIYNTKPIEISLLVNDVHIKYLESLPLHSSQVILPKNDTGQFKVEYTLVPNYEFNTQILKMGPEAKVLSPDSLKKEIKRMLKSTLYRYD